MFSLSWILHHHEEYNKKKDSNLVFFNSDQIISYLVGRNYSKCITDMNLIAKLP